MQNKWHLPLKIYIYFVKHTILSGVVGQFNLEIMSWCHSCPGHKRSSPCQLCRFPCAPGGLRAPMVWGPPQLSSAPQPQCTPGGGGGSARRRAVQGLHSPSSSRGLALWPHRPREHGHHVEHQRLLSVGWNREGGRGARDSADRTKTPSVPFIFKAESVWKFN